MLTSIFIYIAALLLIYVEAAPSFASSEYYLGDHNHASKMLVENKGLMVNVTSTDLAMMKDMIERGNMAMGFNQSKIMHHFIATPTGGEIMIVALNSTDNNTIRQVRNHIMDIQKDFSEGNFTKPFFIHAQEVPGTKLMTERKDLITYDIMQINNGSILLLTTDDQQLISAIHQFIAFQSAQHTGH
jgi:hypothetical protein